MGCCSSFIISDIPNIEGRFPVLEIGEKSDTSSDSSLKARGDIAANAKDKTPLLDDRTLLAFQNLNLSSSSVDVEMDQLENLLKPQEGEDENSNSDNRSDVEDDANGRTFPGVKINLNEIDTSSLSDD